MNKMNASIAHLPEKNQEDLKIIVATILEEVLNVEMIILSEVMPVETRWRLTGRWNTEYRPPTAAIMIFLLLRAG